MASQKIKKPHDSSHPIVKDQIYIPKYPPDLKVWWLLVLILIFVTIAANYIFKQF